MSDTKDACKVQVLRRGDRPFAIFRISSNVFKNKSDEEGFDDTVTRTVRMLRTFPGMFDEVWLSSKNMLYRPDIHARWARILKSGVEPLSRQGVRISLQVAPCFGHFNNSGADPDFFDGPSCERMWDGERGGDNPVPSAPFCPNSRAFRAHMAEALAAYLEELQPYCLYLDDDIRMNSHGSFRNGCFCPVCLEKFAAFSGKKWNCTELYAELTCREKPTAVRKQWTDFNQEQLADFLEFCGRVVHKHAPDCIMALEECNPTDQYNGQDRTKIYRALERSTGHRTHIRVGGGTWDDFAPWELLRKGILNGTAANRAKAGGSVAMTYNEMETAPCAALSKSPHGIALECALTTAYGVQGLSLQMSFLFRTCDDRLIYPYFSFLNSWMPYLKALSKAWEGSRFDGMTMYQPEENLSRRVFQEYERENPNWWCVMFSDELRAPATSGLPVTWEGTLEKNSAVPVLLTMECVEGLSEKEFEDLLRRGVLLTGEAFHHLQSKGMTSFTGVESTRAPGGGSIMTDHPFNAGFAGELWTPEYYYGGFGYTFGRGCRAQALMRHCRPGGTGDISAWILETESGGRMAVCGASPTFSMHQNPSSMHQMYEIFDWLGGRRAPVRSDMYERIAVIPFASQETGKLRGVTVVNCSIYPLDEIRLFIRDPESPGICCHLPGREPRKVTAVPTGEPGEYHLTLPGLAAWHVLTVFCHEE